MIVIVYSKDEDGNVPDVEEKALNDLVENLKKEYSISDENVIRS
jgi:hypothetical protein